MLQPWYEESQDLGLRVIRVRVRVIRVGLGFGADGVFFAVVTVACGLLNDPVAVVRQRVFEVRGFALAAFVEYDFLSNVLGRAAYD